jgi:hypothetical protein
MHLSMLYEDVIIEYVKNIGHGKWRIFSKKGKNLGTYPTEKEAKTRLKQIEYFKHKKG